MGYFLLEKKEEEEEVVEMESQRAMAQAPEKIDKEKWAKVQIYSDSHLHWICLLLSPTAALRCPQRHTVQGTERP